MNMITILNLQNATIVKIIYKQMDDAIQISTIVPIEFATYLHQVTISTMTAAERPNATWNTRYTWRFSHRTNKHKLNAT